MANTKNRPKKKTGTGLPRDGEDGRPLVVTITIPAEDVPAFKAYHAKTRIPYEATTALVLFRAGLAQEAEL